MVLAGIMAKGIWIVSEWYLNDILNYYLYSSMASNAIFNYGTANKTCKLVTWL